MESVGDEYQSTLHCDLDLFKLLLSCFYTLVLATSPLWKGRERQKGSQANSEKPMQNPKTAAQAEQLWRGQTNT